MDLFRNKIRDKRVAILGPADYVNKELGDEHGQYIDSFDTVIRINSMIKLPSKELEKYYGTKFDILYSSFWLTGDKFLENKSRFLYLDSYKDISNQLLLFDFSRKQNHKAILEKYKDFFEENKNFIFIKSNKNNMNLFLKKKFSLKKSPTTGLACILTCLLYEPKELYISGISFYQDKKHNGYYDNYYLNSKEELEKLYKNPKYRFNGINFRPKKIFSHDPNNEYKRFLALREIYKNIKIDNYLQKILNNI